MKKYNILVICMIFLFVYSCATSEFTDSTETVFNKAKESLAEGNYTKAKGEFEFVIFSSPLSSYAADSYFYLGESKYYLNKYNEAILDYEKYLNLPIRDNTLSKKSEFMICKSWFHLSNDVMKDQTDTKIAINKLQYYIEKESMAEYVLQIDEMIFALRNKLAEKDFMTALLYLQLEQEESAIIYFENIINEFYDSDYLDDSLINIAYIKANQDKNIAIEYLKSNKAYFISTEKFQNAIDDIKNR